MNAEETQRSTIKQMRRLLIVILLFIYSESFAGKSDTTGLWKAVHGLNEALKKKDTSTLKQLLHAKLSYCHSNGWCETKGEVIHDLFGIIEYREIGMRVENWDLEQNLACLRTVADVAVRYNGNELNLRLFVTQVWIRQEKRWQLIARQSTKIN